MVPVAGLALSEALPDPPADGDGRRSSTILIIEDDATVRAVVRRHLEADGYRVLEAVDGHSGLDLIETHGGQLDLVLTDIDMPRIDGVTVAEVLAALRPLLGVICMSAGIAESRFVEGLALRPQPFLAKPFTRETLAQVLAAEIARSRELAARLQGGETASPGGATEGEQPVVAAVGLVAAAQRLQHRHSRNGATPKRINRPPHANGRPLASEGK